MPSAEALRAALHTLRAATPSDLTYLGHLLAAEGELADVAPPPAAPAADVYVAYTAIGPAHFHAVGSNALQAERALRDALQRYADDLDIDPAALAHLRGGITVIAGPPGAAFRDTYRYP